MFVRGSVGVDETAVREGGKGLQMLFRHWASRKRWTTELVLGRAPSLSPRKSVRTPSGSKHGEGGNQTQHPGIVYRRGFPQSRSWQEAVVWLAQALLGDQDRPSSPASSYTPLSLGPCSVCDNTARSPDNDNLAC